MKHFNIIGNMHKIFYQLFTLLHKRKKLNIDKNIKIEHHRKYFKTALKLGRFKRHHFGALPLSIGDVSLRHKTYCSLLFVLTENF